MDSQSDLQNGAALELEPLLIVEQPNQAPSLGSTQPPTANADDEKEEDFSKIFEETVSFENFLGVGTSVEKASPPPAHQSYDVNEPVRSRDLFPHMHRSLRRAGGSKRRHHHHHKHVGPHQSDENVDPTNGSAATPQIFVENVDESKETVRMRKPTRKTAIPKVSRQFTKKMSSSHSDADVLDQEINKLRLSTRGSAPEFSFLRTRKDKNTFEDPGDHSLEQGKPRSGNVSFSLAFDEPPVEETPEEVELLQDTRQYDSLNDGNDPENIIVEACNALDMSDKSHTADSTLKDDIDFAYHRFEARRSTRRKRSMPTSIAHHRLRVVRHPGDIRKGSMPVTSSVKKMFDHTPHHLFVQMDELKTWNHRLLWQETARWIKFEETLQEGSDRWGKPHVATLSFHSLLKLRKCIESGCMIFDLEKVALFDVLSTAVERLRIADQIKTDDMTELTQLLLLPHRKVGHKGLGYLRRNSFALLSRIHRFGSNAKDVKVSDLNANGDAKRSGQLSMLKIKRDSSKNSVEEGSTPLATYTPPPISAKSDSRSAAADILVRIPPDSEAAAVLVGTADVLSQPAVAFIRMAEGVIMPQLTEVPLPVRFFFILVGPHESELDYREIGRALGTLLADQEFVEVVYRAHDSKEILTAINEFLDEALVLPRGAWDTKILLGIKDMKKTQAEKHQARKLRHRKMGGARLQDQKSLLKEKAEKEFQNPLRRTGKPFGGMIRDIKRRFPHYKNDILDALNFQCLLTIVFIYFATLAPAMTFGGVLSDKTKRWIGVSETLLATGMNNIVQSLFAGQPLLILGASGPVLVFEYSLYEFCHGQEIEFMAFRWWVGFWISILTIIVVALDGSSYIRYFTRFMEDIFEVLISIVFILMCFEKLHEIYHHHPLLDDYCEEDDYNMSGNRDAKHYVTASHANATTPGKEGKYHSEPTSEPDTALLSTIFMFGTFLVATFMKKFRNSIFLGRTVRRTLGDFGLTFSIILWTLLCEFAIRHTYVEKLYIHPGFSPTLPEKRGWLVHPMGHHKPIELWMIFAAFIPAFMVYILIFLEGQICALIMSDHERGLKKGTSFHLDTFIVGQLAFLNSVFGLPWMCAATVRTMAHVSALTVMSKTHAPGEKSKIVTVYEQRVTNLVVSVLMILSILMGSVLRTVPEAVLFGIFLYMGISNLKGIQLVDRIKMMFKLPKYFPDVRYVRRVKVSRIHLFTIVQVICVGVLIAVKASAAAIAFPFVVLLLVPVRLNLKWFFTPKELFELDGEDSDDDDEDDRDFYEQSHL